MPQPPGEDCNGAGLVDPLVANVENCFSTFGLSHSGQATRSSPRTSSSNVLEQLWQTYS